MGENSEMFNKEMYTFEDKGQRSLTLRPEGTAAVTRSNIMHSGKKMNPLKLYYIGPFRYERPQAGRYRQFHQNIEYIGDPLHMRMQRLLRLVIIYLNHWALQI